MFQVEFHTHLFFRSGKPPVMLVKGMALPFVPVVGMTYLDNEGEWEAVPEIIAWDNTDQTFRASVESLVIDGDDDFDYVQNYLDSGWELYKEDKVAKSEPSPSS